ncbi:hypothetical protein R5R35_000405 [Gryllus longicercus]|uniref:Uncharacterized protein n=1 Tax=Gryllus longicercus TaxID=2509291 RepID=A0AAN9Z3E7_9ORTH
MVVERQPVLPDSSSPEHNNHNGSVKRVRAAPAIYRPPAARKLEALSAQVKQNHSITPTPQTPPVTTVVSKTDKMRSGTKQRRPDQKVYVPRAKRVSMMDQNSSELRNSQNEIVPIKQQICGTKKNALALPLKTQNTTISSSCEKPCHVILPLEQSNDCNSEPTLKKMVMEEPVCVSMVDQNSSEHQNSQNEIVPIKQQILGTKKNALALPLKTQNTTISSSCEKPCHDILPLEQGNVCNSEPTLKKMVIEEPGTKEGHNKIVLENCVVENIPAKCFFGDEIFNTCDSNSASISVDSDTVDDCGVSFANTKNCGKIKSELKDQTMSLSPDTNENSSVNSENIDKWKEKNDKNEISDSRTIVNEVFKCESKQSVKMEVNDYEECHEQEEKNSCEINHSVENSSHSLSVNEKITQPSISAENIIPENKNQVNKKNKKIDRRKLISDVLIISDPEPPVQHVPKQEDNVNKNNTVVKKNKAKPKSENSVVAEKLTNNSASTDNLDSSSTSTSSVSLNPDECTWEMLFDENGDCLDPKIMEELTNAVGSVTIEKPQSDYNRFISRPEINLPGGDGEFAHVVEIYNFPSEFTTPDLLSIFAPYKNGGFEIKWVDDTHALGVFSSSRVAADVLAYEHPFVKTRPLSEATPESRMKARRSAEFLQPYRARPETCVAMARRLVTGALGMRLATSREEREKERRLLKEAREKKRLAAQQQQDAWEGTIR